MSVLVGLLVGAFAATTTLPAATPLPARVSAPRPADPAPSAAVRRMHDLWNPLEDRGDRGQLFSNFLYSHLDGLDYTRDLSRGDPSKVLKIDGIYYVWYARRQAALAPAGKQKASPAAPSPNGDSSEIWLATSTDGFCWNEQGPAIRRSETGEPGWRSVSTPDVLPWGGKYYLYYRGHSPSPSGGEDSSAVFAAEADSPRGPWRLRSGELVSGGRPGEWDDEGITDAYALRYRGQVYLYYQSGKQCAGAGVPRGGQGLAVARHPLGPFHKSGLNPVLNSGRETAFFSWKDGVAAIVGRDGPERNTIQFAPDAENFEVMSSMHLPPEAPGPFLLENFANQGDGRGITWGLCQMQRITEGADGGDTLQTILARFDCDLSRDVERPACKRDRLRVSEAAYLQPALRLPEKIRQERASGKGSSEPKSGTPEAPAGIAGNRTHSAAMHRLQHYWNPQEDRGDRGSLFTTFKYSRLSGLRTAPNVSRRDPSAVIQVDGVYYVWYTSRRSQVPPVGAAKATETVPAQDWDLADIWYATSKDGFTWEEQGVAVRRPRRPAIGWRTLCTPGILLWKGKYFLYVQAYSDVITNTLRCPVKVAVADSPRGPWTLRNDPVVEPGAPGAWDDIKIHDPYPLAYRGKAYLYYKGECSQRELGERMQGLAVANDPGGPFVKCPLNPVVNSGHETAFFPWKEGIAAIVTRDGPEKNTIQFAPDGVNFEVMSMVEFPPIAAGPFIPAISADNGGGKGITWGLCHIIPDGSGATNDSILVRFDCHLSPEGKRAEFMENCLPVGEVTYFQPWFALPGRLHQQLISEGSP